MASRRSDSGQALVTVAAGMVMLLGAMGLAIDMGYMRYERRQMQSAADSAALAGAGEINYGDVVSAAQADAANVGFTNGSNGVSVTVNNPPLSGPHSGDASYVEAVVSQAVPTFFMRLFGVNSASLSARAVGYLGSGGGCIYALDRSATGILVNGVADVEAQCGVIDDSSSASAMLINGAPTVSTKSIGVVGQVLINGPATVSPTPVTGIAVQSDPLAYLNPPTTSSCSGTAMIINGTGTYTVTPGGNCYNLTINGSPVVTVNPGAYQRIVTNGTPRVTFNPGLYTIQGGNFTINGGAWVQSSGATFYLTTGGVTVNGGNTVQFSAPTSGSYAGILFYEDRADATSAVINGDNNTLIQGALYFPKAQLTVNGMSTTAAYSIAVADTILFNGGGHFNDDYSTLPGGSPIKGAVLVE